MTDQLGRDRCTWAARALLAAVFLSAGAGCGGGYGGGGYAGGGHGGSGYGGAPPGPRATGLARLNHVVVIVLENWSFDSLYAEMPGAEGLATAIHAPGQVDATGAVYSTLPQTEAHLPQTLANAPFALDDYIPATAETSADLTTNFYEEQRQIHGGKMDQFVLYNAASKGLTMGYYHTASLPLAAEAAKYTLCDHFFHGVFGGSLVNHIFLVSEGVAQFANAPTSIKRAVLDSAGAPVPDAAGKPQDGPLTPDGYVVGTLFPAGGRIPPRRPMNSWSRRKRFPPSATA